MGRTFPTAICFLLICSSVSVAGVKGKAAKESAKYVLRKFGKEATKDGLGTLTRKIETLAVKHGDEAFQAVRKVGPRAIRLVEEAGEHGTQAIKLMARHGDDAIWVVAKKNRLTIFAKYGDESAEAMMKHREIAEPLLQTIGKPAAGALKAITTKNGRRLAMMANDGTLKKIGRTDELLEVVGKYGDRAMDFIWRHKGSLMVATALTAFLANPEPFIEGVKDITKIGAENVVKPIAEVPGKVAKEIAKKTNWTIILAIVAAIVGALISLKIWLRKRSLSAFARKNEDASEKGS